MEKKKKRVVRDTRYTQKWHPTPLKGSFMVLSIVGLLISTYMIYPRSVNFGIAAILVFAAMFVASLISMTKAPVVES